MTFLNPFLLLGLAAAAIPLVIHLFNFRRPKRVDFSSLAFLRELEKQTMRRVRIRQWLLLALRTLAIACLVLAFAQPALVSAWDGVLGSRVPSSIGLVLDNSLSMTQRDGQGAYLDQAKALATTLADVTQPGDQLTLVTTARGDAPTPDGFAAVEQVLDGIAAAEPQAGSETISSALSRAASLLEYSTHPIQELFVIADLQAATFLDSTTTPVQDGVQITLLPLGERTHTNTAVTEARVESRIVEPGRPVEVAATVVRYGGDAEGYGVSVYLDGERVAQIAADLPANTPTTVRFSFTPNRRGWLGGEIRIEPDDAEWDDTRYFTLHVPETRRVLVVRGAQARADLVGLALGLAAERGAMDVVQVDESALAASGVDDFDAVVLVGLQDVSSGEAGLLARYVEGGGGLVLFPGLNPDGLNPVLAVLGGGRFDGTLGALSGPSLGGFGQADLEHPVFDGVFDGTSGRPRLEDPDVALAGRYSTGGGDETTLIRLAGGTPYLTEVRHGEGRALIYTVAPDPRWSDVPVRGLFVPLLYRSTVYVAASQRMDERWTLGEAGTLRVDGGTDATPLRLVAPDGQEVIPEQRSVPGGVVLEVEGTFSQPGLYDLMQGETLVRRVALNLDPRESDLRVLSVDEARTRLEAATGQPVRVLDAAGGAGLAAATRLQEERGGVPLWTLFLALALVFLLAEMIVAMRWNATLPEGKPQAVSA